MGFASAFASGLIKGFHQNILNEQQARAKDDEKLDGYRQLLMKSVLSRDDVNMSGINAVKSMIKSGEKQLEDRGPIDIFGRPSNRLKMETLDMAGIVNNVGKTVNIGGVDVPVRKSYYENTIIKSPSARANVVIDSFRDLGEDKLRKMFNTPEKKDALAKFYMNSVTNILRPQVLSQDKKEIVQILGPDTIDIHDWMKTIVPVDQSEYSLTSTKYKADGTMKDGDYLLPLGNQSGVIIKSEQFGEYLNKAEQDNLSGLAKLHGFGDTQEYLYQAASQYDNKEDFFESLRDTIKLFTMNAHEAKSREEMIAIGKWMATSEKEYTDPIKASYLMLPLVFNKDFQALDWLRSRGFREGVSGKGFDNRLKQFSGYSFEKLEGDYNALQRTDDQLSQLTSLITEAGVEPDSPISGIFMFFNRIFGDTGYVDQVAGLLGASADSDDANSRAIYARIKREIGGSDVGSALTKIRTLKFIVAADLARAEDSQGRLSDQDLARNLAKLGGNYGTVKQGLQSIKLLQQDIRKKLDGKKMLYKLTSEARGRGYFTAKDRRLLQADYMARQYLTSYHRSIGGKPDEELGMAATSITINDLAKVDNQGNRQYQFEEGYVTSTGGNVYVDESDADNPVYVVVESFERQGEQNVPLAEPKITKQLSADEFNKSIERGEIFTPTDTEGVRGAATIPPMGGGVPAEVTQNLPEPESMPSVSLQDLGLNDASQLPPADGNGLYTIGNKKYKISGMNPMKFQEVQ